MAVVADTRVKVLSGEYEGAVAIVQEVKKGGWYALKLEEEPHTAFKVQGKGAIEVTSKDVVAASAPAKEEDAPTEVSNESPVDVAASASKDPPEPAVSTPKKAAASPEPKAAAAPAAVDDGPDYSKLKLAEAQKLATELGIKKNGKGWAKCCPPNGNLADVIAALDRHRATDAKTPATPDAVEAAAAAEAVSPATDAPAGGRRKARTDAPSIDISDSDATAKALFGVMPLPCQVLYDGEHKDAATRSFSGKLFRRNRPLLDDVHQGDVGNCYFAAALSLIAAFDKPSIVGAIELVPPTATGGARLFHVTFGVPVRGKVGRKVTVTVDDRFYMDTNGVEEYKAKGDDTKEKEKEVLEALGRERGLEELAAKAKGIDTEEVDPDKWDVKTRDWAPPKGTKADVVKALQNDRCPPLDEPLYLNTGDKTAFGCVWPMVLEKAWAVFLPKVTDGLLKLKAAPCYDYTSADNPVAQGLTNVADVCAAVGGWTSENLGEGCVSKDTVTRLYKHVEGGEPAALGTKKSGTTRMDELKLYAGHQYGVLGALEHKGEPCFILRNPHNKLKGGPGPEVADDDDEDDVPGKTDEAKGYLHRAVSIPDIDLWLQSSTRKKKAADTFLLPMELAYEAGVFETIILLTKAGVNQALVAQV